MPCTSAARNRKQGNKKCDSKQKDKQVDGFRQGKSCGGKDQLTVATVEVQPEAASTSQMLVKSDDPYPENHVSTALAQQCAKGQTPRL